MEEVDRGIAAAAAGQAAAEAQRDLAVSTLARYQRLLDRKSVAPQEYDQVAAQQKAAAAAVDRAIAEGQAIRSKRAQILARIETAGPRSPAPRSCAATPRSRRRLPGS